MRKKRECKMQVGWRESRKQDPLSQHDRRSYEFKEPESKSKGMEGSASSTCQMYYGFQFSVLFFLYNS